MNKMKITKIIGAIFITGAVVFGMVAMVATTKVFAENSVIQPVSSKDAVKVENDGMTLKKYSNFLTSVSHFH